MYYDLRSTSDTYTLSDPPMTLTPVPKPDRRLSARYIFSRLGLALAVLSFSMLVGQLLVDGLLMAMISNYETAWWRSWVLSLVPLYAIGLPLMLLSLRGVRTAPHNPDYILGADTFQKPTFSVKHFTLIIPIAFACMYIGSYIGNFIMLCLSGITGYDYTSGIESLVTESPLWMTVLGTCVCAPVGEEFIFRKLLIDRTRRFGDGISILFSGLLFGLFHGNLFQFFYAFLLGMLLAYLYTRTGNIWWCVTLHGIANLMGGVIIPALAGLIDENPASLFALVSLLVTLLLSAWTLGMIITGSILFARLRKQRKLSAGTAHVRVRGCFRTVFLNPGMITTMIFMVLMLLLSLIPV